MRAPDMNRHRKLYYYLLKQVVFVCRSHFSHSFYFIGMSILSSLFAPLSLLPPPSLPLSLSLSLSPPLSPSLSLSLSLQGGFKVPDVLVHLVAFKSSRVHVFPLTVTDPASCSLATHEHTSAIPSHVIPQTCSTIHT